jgi:hypothetical protein
VIRPLSLRGGSPSVILIEMFGAGWNVRVAFGETRLTERLLSRAVYVSSARLPSGKSP